MTESWVAHRVRPATERGPYQISRQTSAGRGLDIQGYARRRQARKIDGVAELLVDFLSSVEIERIDAQGVTNTIDSHVLKFVLPKAVSDGVKLAAIALNKYKLRQGVRGSMVWLVFFRGVGRLL